MSNTKENNTLQKIPDISEEISEKESRKIRARKHKDEGIWFGLGTFGMVGWSVAIPTLVGIAIGIWIDQNWPSRFSWTLMLLMAGLFTGCLSAWYWLNFESQIIKEEETKEDNQID